MSSRPNNTTKRRPVSTSGAWALLSTGQTSSKHLFGMPTELFAFAGIMGRSGMEAEAEHPLCLSGGILRLSGSLTNKGCTPAATTLLLGPHPIPQLRRIYTVFMRVVYALDDLVLQPLLSVRCRNLQLRHAINHINCEIETIHLV
jgi:hypothetical protein